MACKRYAMHPFASQNTEHKTICKKIVVEIKPQKLAVGMVLKSERYPITLSQYMLLPYNVNSINVTGGRFDRTESLACLSPFPV